MRSRALPLARRWRLETRRIFEHYLSARYRVEQFFPLKAAAFICSAATGAADDTFQIPKTYSG
jgi:hypothetical protein